MNKAFYLVLSIGALFIVSGCASKPPKVPTFEEAVKEGDIESGWYTKKNRENVYVDVQAPRQKQEEAEKKAFDLQREADYAKRQNDQLQYENMLLRVRGNYKLEKEVNELQGFDNQNNPVIRQKTVNPEPQQRPELQMRPRYIDKSTDRVQVQYNDPTRLTNETSYPPGHGGANVDYPSKLPQVIRQPAQVPPQAVAPSPAQNIQPAPAQVQPSQVQPVTEVSPVSELPSPAIQ